MDDISVTWQRLSSEQIADCRVFSVNRNSVRITSDRDLGTHQFYILHPSNWVNVIPVTTDGQVVMVSQYRHGIESDTLEIPGGMVDAEDPSSLAAAKRELFEETGYVSNNWVKLGTNHPNPALQSNTCDTYLAIDAQQIQKPEFDGSGTEIIKLRLVPIAEISELIKSGEITHALVLVAFYMLQLHETGRQLVMPMDPST